MRRLTGLEQFAQLVSRSCWLLAKWSLNWYIPGPSMLIGLDDIYRKFFRGSEDPVKVSKHSWDIDPGKITSSNLKAYFSEVLLHHGIYKKESWINASQRFLMYSEVQKVCRFVLFLAGHDRVSDGKSPGLTGPGNVNVCNLLSLERWRSTDHKSLEHVAPQAPPNGHLWDSDMVG